MKSELIPAESETPVTAYPIFLESIENNMIVMFLAPRGGVVVHSTLPTRPVGYQSVTWVDDSDTTEWKRFNGAIKLSN